MPASPFSWTRGPYMGGGSPAVNLPSYGSGVGVQLFGGAPPHPGDPPMSPTSPGEVPRPPAPISIGPQTGEPLPPQFTGTRPVCPLPPGLPPGGTWELELVQLGGARTWTYRLNGQVWRISEERGQCRVYYGPYAPRPSAPSPAQIPPGSPMGRTCPVQGLPEGGQWLPSNLPPGQTPLEWIWEMPNGARWVVRRIGTECTIVRYIPPPRLPGQMIPRTTKPSLLQGVRGRCANLAGLGEAIYGILTDYADERAACRAAREHLTDILHGCLSQIRDALSATRAHREALGVIGNSCPGMNAECRRRLGNNLNWLADAIKRMEEIERETNALFSGLFNMSCGGDDVGGLPGVPPAPGFPRPIGPEAPGAERLPGTWAYYSAQTEKLCGQSCDAMNTANLWGAEVDKFRRACSCRQIEAAATQKIDAGGAGGFSGLVPGGADISNQGFPNP